MSRMSLKNKVGNFLILFGLILLIVFIGSVLSPPETVDTTAFLISAALLGVGVNFRMSKVRPRAGGPPGAGGGGGGGGGGELNGMPAKAKPGRQGLFAKVLHGPANKQKTAPSGARPASAGGGGGKGGGGGGGGKGGGGGAPKGGGRR